MPNYHSIGNFAEAIVWFVVAAIFLVFAVRGSNRLFTFKCLIGALAFASFGVSDLVEIKTGAWWHPWWLLAWKATCVLVFFGLWWSSRKPKTNQDGDRNEGVNSQ